MYLTRAGLDIRRQAWADAEGSMAEARKQLERLTAERRPILEVSIALTSGALREAQGRIAAARQAFALAATTARASLPPGATNRARAEAALAAFSARHK